MKSIRTVNVPNVTPCLMITSFHTLISTICPSCLPSYDENVNLSAMLYVSVNIFLSFAHLKRQASKNAHILNVTRIHHSLWSIVASAVKAIVTAYKFSHVSWCYSMPAKYTVNWWDWKMSDVASQSVSHLLHQVLVLSLIISKDHVWRFLKRTLFWSWL